MLLQSMHQIKFQSIIKLGIPRRYDIGSNLPWEVAPSCAEKLYRVNGFFAAPRRVQFHCEKNSRKRAL